MMRIIESLEAVQRLPGELQRASEEIRLTRYELSKELKNTRVLAEKAFLSISRQLTAIENKLDNKPVSLEEEENELRKLSAREAFIAASRDKL